jgi:hypothetical protein
MAGLILALVGVQVRTRKMEGVSAARSLFPKTAFFIRSVVCWLVMLFRKRQCHASTLLLNCE